MNQRTFLTMFILIFMLTLNVVASQSSPNFSIDSFRFDESNSRWDFHLNFDSDEQKISSIVNSSDVKYGDLTIAYPLKVEGQVSKPKIKVVFDDTKFFPLYDITEESKKGRITVNGVCPSCTLFIEEAAPCSGEIYDERTVVVFKGLFGAEKEGVVARYCLIQKVIGKGYQILSISDKSQGLQLTLTANGKSEKTQLQYSASSKNSANELVGISWYRLNFPWTPKYTALISNPEGSHWKVVWYPYSTADYEWLYDFYHSYYRLKNVPPYGKVSLTENEIIAGDLDKNLDAKLVGLASWFNISTQNLNSSAHGWASNLGTGSLYAEGNETYVEFGPPQYFGRITAEIEVSTKFLPAQSRNKCSFGEQKTTKNSICSCIRIADARDFATGSGCKICQYGVVKDKRGQFDCASTPKNQLIDNWFFKERDISDVPILANATKWLNENAGIVGDAINFFIGVRIEGGNVYTSPFDVVITIMPAGEMGRSVNLLSKLRNVREIQLSKHAIDNFKRPDRVAVMIEQIANTVRNPEIAKQLDKGVVQVIKSVSETKDLRVLGKFIDEETFRVITFMKTKLGRYR